MLTLNLQILLFIFSVLNIFPIECFYPVYPEQIHLSLGRCPFEMVVTWVTFSNTRESVVWFGKVSEGLTQRTGGYIRKFTSKKYSQRVRYVHRVTLTELEPFNFYVYRCGSWLGISQPFIFKMIPQNVDWSPRLIIFGDMGFKGAAVLPYILNEVKNYHIDAVVHVGDMAYNLATYDGRVGDQFMNMIQPLAGSIPYMTCVGNHEQYLNFTHYKNLFSMPGNHENLYYSFDLGPVHFVTISSEVYYFTQYGIQPLINQYNWLKNDLEKATQNRSLRPWIIVFSHRPMYCSSDDKEDCSTDRSILRCCLIGSSNYGLEELFQKYRVDLIFSGHMHYYERSWPIYKRKVYNGSYADPYRNPGAAVHIISGAAGMKSGTEKVSSIRSDYFGFFSSDYSYTILTAFNKSLIYLEQVSASEGGKVIDSACFVKELQSFNKAPSSSSSCPQIPP